MHCCIMRSRPCRALAITALMMAQPLAGSMSAALAQAPQVPIVRVPLVAWIASRPHAFPETLPDFAVDPERIAQFRSFLDALSNQEWPQALEQANSMSYQVVMIRESGNDYIIASDDSNTGRDPTIILNMTPRLDFLVEAPHVPFEPGTAEQAGILLKELGGRAAIISGADRCASRSFTTCDGSTEVCNGVTQRYRDSDPGHNVSTLFHTAHVVFSARWPAALVMSLHGMMDDTKGVRTSLIISNGTNAADDPSANTPATRLRIAVGDYYGEPGAVVSCNLQDDERYKFRKLCGTTNVQGRQVNGEADACHRSVSQPTGRFIHMEQDWAVREPYAREWAEIGEYPYNTALIRGLKTILAPVQSP
jgi:hypothetical protein